jgi:hypothetical protein
MTLLRFTTVLVFVAAVGAAGQTQKPPARPRQPPAKTPAKPAPKAATPTPTPAPAPLPTDVDIVSTYTTGDKVATTTVQMKGARQRIEYGNDLVTLVQCDAARTIQLNEKTRTFVDMPFDDQQQTLPPAPPNSKGGKITYTTTVTDTGEKKTMFGYPASHLLTVVAKEASPTACDKKPERVETDGWYIDLPPTTTCRSAPDVLTQIQVDPRQPMCRDEVHFVRASTVAVGYPVAYTMTATADAKPAVTTLEVTSFKTTNLQASSFDLPEGYLQVKNATQLMADHRPGEIVAKKPGVKRVGVAPIANKTDRQFERDRMVEALAETLSESDLDIVLLTGDSPAAVEADAKAKDCDYILDNTVSELKKGSGGVLGKISGSSSEEINARVDFALIAPGVTKPALATSERSGTSTLQSAVGAAKRVGQLVAPLIMMQYQFMNVFASMGGGASTMALGQGSDPVLSSLFKLLERPPDNSRETYSTEEAAIATAMQKETQAVITELQTRKK